MRVACAGHLPRSKFRDLLDQAIIDRIAGSISGYVGQDLGSPLSHASLRSRISLAISKYMIAKAIALPRAKASVGQMAIRQAAEGPRDSRFLKNITNTANGMNKWAFAVPIYLVAQTVDLYVDHVGHGIDAHTPHAIQNHGARHYTSSITNQVLKHGKLLRRQLQQFLASAGIAADEIQFKIGDSQTSRLRLSWRIVAEEVADSRQQFGQREGFGQVVVAALFETRTRSSTERRADKISTGAV